MFRKKSFETHIETLGVALLDHQNVKAIMMSKNEIGDVVVTLVEGMEESHKV